MTNQINTSKGELNISLDAITFFSDGFYVSHIPALNIVSHNKDEVKSKEDLKYGLELFFKHWNSSEKLEQRLIDLGWEKQPTWRPKKGISANVPLAMLTGKTYEAYSVPALIPA